MLRLRLLLLRAPLLRSAGEPQFSGRIRFLIRFTQEMRCIKYQAKHLRVRPELEGARNITKRWASVKGDDRRGTAAR